MLRVDSLGIDRFRLYGLGIDRVVRVWGLGFVRV